LPLSAVWPKITEVPERPLTTLFSNALPPLPPVCVLVRLTKMNEALVPLMWVGVTAAVPPVAATVAVRECAFWVTKLLMA
jgi:hypothetical protein